MNKQENKRLVKLLTEKKRELKHKNIQIEQITLIKRPRIDKKYVSDNDYKELVVLYETLKEKSDLSIAEVEKLIVQNSVNFPFLKKCYDSIYDFVSELRFGGPYYIAKEMSRQGKQVDYINTNILKSDK